MLENASFYYPLNLGSEIRLDVFGLQRTYFVALVLPRFEILRYDSSVMVYTSRSGAIQILE